MRNVLVFICFSCLFLQCALLPNHRSKTHAPVTYTDMMLTGTWQVEKIKWEDTELKEELEAHVVQMAFSKDGKITYQKKDGQLIQGVYQLKENKIVDPSDTTGTAMEILLLADKRMQLKMPYHSNAMMLDLIRVVQ